MFSQRSATSLALNTIGGASNWPALITTTRLNAAVFEAPVSLGAPRYFRLAAP
jgi:hypothetical protein